MITNEQRKFDPCKGTIGKAAGKSGLKYTELLNLNKKYVMSLSCDRFSFAKINSVLF